jgi:hypothetical protein
LVLNPQDTAHLRGGALGPVDGGVVRGGQRAVGAGGDDDRGGARVVAEEGGGQPGGVLAGRAGGQELRVAGLGDVGQARQQPDPGDHTDDPHGDDQPSEPDIETGDGLEHQRSPCLCGVRWAVTVGQRGV